MQKYIQLNFFLKEGGGEKKLYLLITMSEELCVLVGVLLSWSEMHKESPKPVCRCLRFH